MGVIKIKEPKVMSASGSMEQESSSKVPSSRSPSLALPQLPLSRPVRWRPDPHEAWPLVKCRWHATPPSRLSPARQLTSFNCYSRTKASASLSPSASPALRTKISSPAPVPPETVAMLPAQVPPNTPLQPTRLRRAAEPQRWASVRSRSQKL